MRVGVCLVLFCFVPPFFFVFLLPCVPEAFVLSTSLFLFPLPFFTPPCRGEGRYSIEIDVRGE